jgi:hypothetical protein
MIEKAMWAHGHGMAIERPESIRSEWRAGPFIRVVGARDTTNWFHFAVPTPVIVNDNRLRLESVLIRFRSNSTSADVTNVHVFDGEGRIAAHDGLNLSPTSWGMHRFVVAGAPEVLWGIGVTIGVRFSASNDDGNTMEFAAAGCDFQP